MNDRNILDYCCRSVFSGSFIFISSQSNTHLILHMLPNLHPIIFIIFLIYFNTYRMMNTLYHLNIIYLTIFTIFTLCVLVFPGCWLVLPLNPQGRSRLAMCSGVRWIAETLQTAPDSTWVSNMADVVFRITAGVRTESVSVRSTIRYIWQRGSVYCREVNSKHLRR